MGTVTILGRAGCGACIFTERALDLAGIRYVIVDVDKDAGAAAAAHRVARELGLNELPIVLCEDGSQWAGLQLDRIAGLVRAAGLS